MFIVKLHLTLQLSKDFVSQAYRIKLEDTLDNSNCSEDP